jgi:hypothetical protein
MDDTLAEFRQLLPNLSREQLRQFREHSHPWLMPWTVDERARAASAWSAFLDEQALSTNAAVALTARLIGIRDLSLRNTPVEEDAFLRRQQAALTYVKHRQTLLCQEPELVNATLSRLDRLVRQAGGSVNFSYGMRTNGLHVVVTEGACFDDSLLARFFYAVPFDTNHLIGDAVVVKIADVGAFRIEGVREFGFTEMIDGVGVGPGGGRAEGDHGSQDDQDRQQGEGGDAHGRGPRACVEGNT